MGLIANNMPPQQGAPQEPSQEPLPQQPEMEDDEPGDAALFQKAMDIAREGLYKKGGAEAVLEAGRRAPSAAQGAADAAYNIVSAADEMAGGVPDDYLALLGTSVLEEVADIAEAGGVALKNSELAEAVKMMILRFVEESGADASQLRAAMDQVPTSEFDKEDPSMQTEEMPQ